MLRQSYATKPPLQRRPRYTQQRRDVGAWQPRLPDPLMRIPDRLRVEAGWSPDLRAAAARSFEALLRPAGDNPPLELCEGGEDGEEELAFLTHRVDGKVEDAEPNSTRTERLGCHHGVYG